jgi:hypothetical protein
MSKAPEHLTSGQLEPLPTSLALERPLPIRVTIGGQKLDLSEVEALEAIGVLAAILERRGSRG